MKAGLAEYLRRPRDAAKAMGRVLEAVFVKELGPTDCALLLPATLRALPEAKAPPGTVEVAVDSKC